MGIPVAMSCAGTGNCSKGSTATAKPRSRPARHGGSPRDGARRPRVASRAADTKGFDNNIGKYVSLAYLEAEENNF